MIYIKKIYRKAQKHSFTFILLSSCFGNSKKLPEKVSAPETYIMTKYRFHHAVSSLQCYGNFKKPTPQYKKNEKKKLWK